MKNNNLRKFALASTLAASTPLASASEGDYLNSLSVSGAPDSPWEVTGAASLGLAKGNADNLTYALQVLATYEQGQTQGLLGADLFYAESNGVATTNNFRLFGQYNRLLSDKVYVGAFGSYLTDDISDIKYRVDAGLTLGYNFINNGTTKLSFEAGPGYTWEEQGGIINSYPSIRFVQRFEHQLTQRSKIWQSATFSPEMDDFNNHLLIAEAGIDVLLSSQWSLRTSVRYQYDTTPAAGRQSDDVLFLTGLSYSLGGFPDPAEAGRQTLKPDAAAPEAIQMGWSSTAALTLSSASGNADNLFLGVTVDSAYRTAAHETFISALYGYAENSGNVSADSIRANVQHNRILNDKLFLGASLGYFRDDIADVSYRLTPAATLGYYLIKNDEMTLSLEAGPSYLFEEVGGMSNDFFVINAAERFSWEISDRLTFNQNVVGLFDPSDSSNYLITANASLDTDITPNLSWRIAAAWTHDNTPAANLKKDDTTLTTGIAVKF